MQQFLIMQGLFLEFMQAGSIRWPQQKKNPLPAKTSKTSKQTKKETNKNKTQSNIWEVSASERDKYVVLTAYQQCRRYLKRKIDLNCLQKQDHKNVGAGYENSLLY